MSHGKPQVTIPNTEVHTFRSTIVDQEYQLSISLPSEYDESNERYPVVYITDANWFFTNFSLMRWLPIPPFIAVGIGYPQNDFASVWRLRSRDFLATQNKEYEKLNEDKYGAPTESGGGENFLSFFRQELLPYVEQSFRTIPNDRTLFCYSFGGAFGVYTLFHQPDTFSRYIIGAPDLDWDDEVAFRYEQEFFEKGTDLPVKLFFGVGTDDEDVVIDRMVSTLFRFHAIIKSRNYENLDMTFDVFKGESHMTAILPTASWGLRAVFRAEG